MTKTFYYLIKIQDDSENGSASDFKIVASKKGDQLPCGHCQPKVLPNMELIDFIDNEKCDGFPYIAF
tara:strand:- start:203 stop:403 length:201 start_codon:yes stop_codon:yes gene_type:complete